MLTETAVTISAAPPSGASLGASALRPTDEPMVLVGADKRPVVWRTSRWDEPDTDHRRLTLDAQDAPLRAELSFGYDSATGLVTLRGMLRHAGARGEIDLRAARSFAFQVREPVDRMFYLTGGWAEETEIQRAHPDDGVLTLESRSGKTGFQFQPYIALRTEADTYLCQLFWSGNWRLQVEPKKDSVLVSGGLNDWHFRHRLAPGESLELPTVLFGRISGPLNTATQRLHDFRRGRAPNPERPIPVQFNGWMALLSGAYTVPPHFIAERHGDDAVAAVDP